jgi:nicotinamidase-related amidase
MAWDAEKLDPEYPFDLFAVRFELDARHAALVVIDMQVDYLHIDEDSPVGAGYPQLRQYFNDRVDAIVMPQTVRLIQAFHDRTLRVAYTRNGCMTSTGDEMSPRLRALNSPPKLWRGTPRYEIAEAIYPRSEDLVVDKLVSGGFTSTQLDHGLRNYGATDVVIAGVFTDMCVLGTARAAAELGYNTVICEDCTATTTQRAHDEALLAHARRFGRVATVDEILEEL